MPPPLPAPQWKPKWGVRGALYPVSRLASHLGRSHTESSGRIHCLASRAGTVRRAARSQSRCPGASRPPADPRRAWSRSCRPCRRPRATRSSRQTVCCAWPWPPRRGRAVQPYGALSTGDGSRPRRQIGVGSLLGPQELTVQQIQQRIASRYPQAEPVPGRPALDDLLREAGH